MDQAQVAARETLNEVADTCTDSGLVDAWQALVQDVYASNLDRFEPNELGDTVMSFGIQCYENLKSRALRRFRHDDLEIADAHWDIDGLRVGTPGNVLTFNFAGARFVTMKVPFSEGRSPNWDRSGDWDQGSQVRSEIATENSNVLQYKTPAPGASPLFPHLGSPGDVRSFMLLWAGESSAALTAGWLGIPILGETPFIAHKRLWYDLEPDTLVTQKSTPDRGPSFDERPAARPAVALKEQRREGQA
ncbi:hypothetical protein [Pseudactinotalea sp. HY158]|uniref:hypothetical protein n=1 Tax=Pseudactinotalea sp. HY158 TaxID=2654547 RepID=UPI00129C1B5C|nr:hypothetical protein [Pseudactinotalea sp. HY158]QGH69569.1 hypothetical protein GCE65_08620 [Pseudactinotalea sp. HY158]